MARFVLALAIAVSALGILASKIWELLGRQPIMFFDLILMLPAVLLGSICWWKGRSYARSWPVVLCVALVWISLFYPGNVEIQRGSLIAALVTIPLPLAALIVEQRAWAFCAKVYVWANAAMMMAALWFESRVEHNIFQVLGRFGFLVRADGSGHTGNPNQLGGQLAFAAVVAFILYLKSSEEREERTNANMPDLYLVLMVFLSTGCLLTASRGAFFSWLPAMGLLFFLGTGNLSRSRARDLVALSTAGLLVVMGLLVAGKATPWERLQERLGDRQNLGSLSNRTQIWGAALKAWQSHPDFVWRGTGIGMADDVLGQYSPMPDDNDEGVLRKNCHNGVIEWLLSLGILGIVGGACLAGSVAFQTFQLDSRDRNIGRSAMIICVVIFAMTAVSYRHKCWPATGALVLAMLTEPAVRRREKLSGSDSALHGHHFSLTYHADCPRTVREEACAARADTGVDAELKRT